MTPGAAAGAHLRFADLTTVGVGGPILDWVPVHSTDEFVAAVTDAQARQRPITILGGGSNIVAADEPHEQRVIGVRTSNYSIVDRDSDGLVMVRAEAGVDWDEFVQFTLDEGLSGLESLSGIPGTVGATPIQNVGAYGHDVSELISEVELLDCQQVSAGFRLASASTESARVRRASPDCRFGYRTSQFKQEADRWAVLAVTFSLRRSQNSLPVTYRELADRLEIPVGSTAPPATVRNAVLEARRRKGMVLDETDYDTWSVGSFFTNPMVSRGQLTAALAACPQWPVDAATGLVPDAQELVKLSAAWLIEQSGIHRGWPGAGAPARVSTKHTLAITNRAHASSADIVDLARAVADRVADRFGIHLEPEARLVGMQWERS